MTTSSSNLAFAVSAPQSAPVEDRALLDVTQSVLGKKWVVTPGDARMAQAMAQAYGVPEIVGRLLSSRGVSFDGVTAFMNPSLKASLPDPYVMKDMDKAAERIADAIVAKQNVAVFGDYDVDGATSSALLIRYFRAFGRDIAVHIPDRLKEGYGPNAAALQKLRANGADLLITVDCGVTAFDAIAAGTNAGLDIVILDHHRAEPSLPDCHAVVNPNRLDDESGLNNMAAVGVVFMTLIAVNRVLRQRGYFAQNNVAEPHILQWLDIVALGTVCDVVPLTGINRSFVAQGLRVMAMRQNAGIVALSDLNNLSEQPGTFHAGFVFGPRVNAGGRVGESYLGAKLLSTDDAIEARLLAEKLHAYNAERKTIEESILLDAMDQAQQWHDRGDQVLLIAGEGWHPGVIGIVAARVKEKFNKPSCVVAFDDHGIGKASCRSVGVVDLGGAVIAAKQSGILVAGGGHKMAAGFTVEKIRLEELRVFLNTHVADQTGGVELVPELRVDGVLSGHALTRELVDNINQLGPFGAGHSEPRFALSHVRIVKAKVVGDKHVSCFIQDNAGGASVKAIAFRAMDSELGPLLLSSGGQLLHVAGQATLNTWLGKTSVNFQIADAAVAF